MVSIAPPRLEDWVNWTKRVNLSPEEAKQNEKAHELLGVLIKDMEKPPLSVQIEEKFRQVWRSTLESIPALNSEGGEEWVHKTVQAFGSFINAEKKIELMVEVYQKNPDAVLSLAKAFQQRSYEGDPFFRILAGLMSVQKTYYGEYDEDEDEKHDPKYLENVFHMVGFIIENGNPQYLSKIAYYLIAPKFDHPLANITYSLNQMRAVNIQAYTKLHAEITSQFKSVF